MSRALLHTQSAQLATAYVGEGVARDGGKLLCVCITQGRGKLLARDCFLLVWFLFLPSGIPGAF
jgi:hypothetical protein